MPGAFMATSRTARGRTKLGEMLRATERAKGTRLAGRKIGCHPALQPKDDSPTLSDLVLYLAEAEKKDKAKAEEKTEEVPF